MAWCDAGGAGRGGAERNGMSSKTRAHTSESGGNNVFSNILELLIQTQVCAWLVLLSPSPHLKQKETTNEQTHSRNQIIVTFGGEENLKVENK